MGILEMDFERILGVPFFHSSSHSIMLWQYWKGKLEPGFGYWYWNLVLVVDYLAVANYYDRGKLWARIFFSFCVKPQVIPITGFFTYPQKYDSIEAS